MKLPVVARLVIVFSLFPMSIAMAQFSNPGFENGFTNGVGNGWTFFTQPSGGNGEDDTSRRHSGSHSQKINLPSAPGHAGIFQTITTTPGQVYRVKFWLYTFAAHESYSQEVLETFVGFDSLGRNTYDHAGTVANSDWNVGWIRANDERDEWTEFTREFMADANQATILIRGFRKIPESAALWIDDLSITAVGMTSPTTHGIVPPPTAPSLNGGNLLTNPDFENGFNSGVGSSWQKWTATGSGTFEPSSDLGKIGGGHYNGASYMETLSTTAKVAFAMAPGLGMLTAIKNNNNDVVTCGRQIIDDFNFWDCSDAETIAWGRSHAQNCYSEHLSYPGIDCWQGYNEPWIETLERARKVLVFEKAFTERCHELGIRSLVLNAAVGTPNTLNAPIFRDLFAIADFIGYHSYGGPNDQFQTGPEANDHSLRWRTIANIYEQNDWRMPPVVYTEAGTYGPWKGRYSKTTVATEYADFGPVMMADEWNIGETIFTVGCFGYWCEWDIDDWSIIQPLMTWNLANSADARGGKSQKWEHNGAAAFKGGLVQAVSTVADGEYWLSGWLKYETGNGGDPVTPDVAVKIGYDPTGQTSNGNAGTIVWSSDQIVSRYLPSHMWHDFGLSVEASGSQTSIWFAIDQTAAGTSAKFWIDDLDMRASDGTVVPTNNPPTADASANVTSGDAPLSVNFNGTGSSDPDNDSLTYTWTWGDGTANGSGSTSSHTFNSAGTYNVVLTVNDGKGGSDTDSITITANSTGGGTPVAIVNGDFSDGLNGWSQWTERGTITFSNSSNRGSLSGNNINGGIYQQFDTGGIGTVIDVTGWWATNPATANNQWAEVLIINGSRTPSNGSDVNDGQSDVEMIYKNDTWVSTSGWSGDMDQTAPISNVGTFTANDTVATIILKMGNGGGSTNGTLFDNIVVTGPDVPTPTIALSKSSVSASCTQGSNPAANSFTVSNSGTDTLNYSINDNVSWLSCSPSSGTSTGEADTISITYIASSLSANTYNATITVSDPNATNNAQTIAVTLTVDEVVSSSQPGDIDGDGDVDATDVSLFRGCITGAAAGPPEQGCGNADIDQDNDVDQSDFGVLQQCLSGTAIPADPNCAD